MCEYYLHWYHFRRVYCGVIICTFTRFYSVIYGGPKLIIVTKTKNILIDMNLCKISESIYKVIYRCG